jgi:uncharacterized protein YhjY with autotransporter beta-barrel domain
MAMKIAVAGLLLIVVAASPLHAQTLDEQYEFYMVSKCEQLEFEREPLDRFTLLPGQAGPHLTEYCSGAEMAGSGLIVVNAPSGGGAVAAVGRGALNDDALRRRREESRDESIAAAHIQRGGAASADASWANGLGLFFSTDYRDEQQAATRYEGGRDSSGYTITFGGDYRFGSVLAGLAIQSEDMTGNFASGGEFKARSYGATIYGSWSPIDALFIDVSGGTTRKQIETTRIVGRTIYSTPVGGTTTISYDPAYAPVHGDTDSHARRADALVGYDINMGRYSIGPRASANYLRTTTDAYLETGNSAMSLAIDEQLEDSLQLALGLQAGAAFTVDGVVLAPQINLNWINERRNDQRAIGARFAEDLRPNAKHFTFLNQPPDRDLYTARISVVAIFRNGLSAFVSAEKLYKHEYREQVGASAGVRWEL